jgi:hypothetical protein
MPPSSESKENQAKNQQATDNLLAARFVYTSTLKIDIVARTAVAIQRPRDRQYTEPFLGNGSVNTFPWQWT